LHWDSPNNGANNESGFSALPGGAFWVTFESLGGYFTNIGTSGNWWSATSSGNSMSAITNLSSNSIGCIHGSGPWNSFVSVRCIKDN